MTTPSLSALFRALGLDNALQQVPHMNWENDTDRGPYFGTPEEGQPQGWGGQFGGYTDAPGWRSTYEVGGDNPQYGHSNREAAWEALQRFMRARDEGFTEPPSRPAEPVRMPLTRSAVAQPVTPRPAPEPVWKGLTRRFGW